MDYYTVLRESWASQAEPERWSLEEVYQGRSLQPFAAGAGIELLPGQVWVVYRGIVQLSTLHWQGEEVIVGFAVPAMPFGLPLTTLSPYRALAITEVNLMSLTVTEIAHSPKLSQSLFWYLLHRQRQTEAFLAIANCQRVEERLRHFLWLLHRELGQKVERGVRLPCRLTHQTIANAISSTRVTVTRLLGQLQREGSLIIDKDRHFILTPKFVLP
ncbi:MAG: Crp/Fnr family transcriptional regulator [Pseudanabaenaceae cyanobacterium SKYGB_i_bin29]|nr:Crp/Fnr family transcriptional regulator [Pseudanabaenaceae cyanobacterium SKYG29]MDW8421616.1 Crp/Fnr family transcriptional regulator [Pseudanabaenaceae cyanobacterium SKYGB_i_bin29]